MRDQDRTGDAIEPGQRESSRGEQVERPGPGTGGAYGEAPDDQMLRPQVSEPPTQQTSFGAPTVGGAVAAASMAGRDRADEPDVSDEDAVAPGDGSV